MFAFLYDDHGDVQHVVQGMSNQVMKKPSQGCLIFLTLIIFPLTSSFAEDESYPSEGLEYVEQFKDSVVENEFIVKFRHLYKSSTRKKYISSALTRVIEESNSPSLSWRILSRENVAAQFPSDFDVLFLGEDLGDDNKGIELAISSLKEHPFIKHVTPQRMITRTLKAVNVTSLKSSRQPLSIRRKLLRAIPRSMTSIMKADILWSSGITGSGVRVGIFDTGISLSSRKHFRRLMSVTDWTNSSSEDTLGHGTFVAGVIASSYSECIGFAPNADLYIFRVFTNSQVSYTSWFLDAFNYAILVRVSVLNLSIGGPDFMDDPFVDKVWELTANNVVMVSAIGNDGPLYGSLNNPADQADVIGVGGMNGESKIAKFSSRGMTTHQLPTGYGRVKPDILAYSSNLRSLRNDGQTCRTLSGTSVAAPVVSGAVALVMSSEMSSSNPGLVKQALIKGADRLKDIPMFEQGSGKINLLAFYKEFRKLVHQETTREETNGATNGETNEDTSEQSTPQTSLPRASLFPDYIDLTEDPYFWPYSTQDLYYSAMPVIVNLTVINGMSVTGSVSRVEWRPSFSSQDYLQVSFSYPDLLWPYSGWLAIHLWVSESGKEYEGVVKGVIVVEINGGNNSHVSISVALKAKVIPTPHASKRILWDQYHNLGYPKGYFPRDNLLMKKDPLDWNGDHVHTNFKDMYSSLRSRGYFVEVLGQPFTCFDANNYNALLMVDPEEEYFEQEVVKLKRDFKHSSLSIVVFSDWFNKSVMQKIKFFDDDKWWTPDTGGANVPALNGLLSNFGVSLGSRVFEGDFPLGQHAMYYASGSAITAFPKEDSLLVKVSLRDQGQEVMKEVNAMQDNVVAVLGLYYPKEYSGRLAVYGDSNCLDSAHLVKDCFWLLDAILHFTVTGVVPDVLEKHRSVNDLPHVESLKPIDRIETTNLHKYSKVLDPNLVPPALTKRPLPSCLHLKPEVPGLAVNDSYVDDLLNKIRNPVKEEITDDWIERLPDVVEEHFSYTTRSIFHWKTLVFFSIIFVLIYFVFKRRLRRRFRWLFKSKPRIKNRSRQCKPESNVVSDVQTLIKSDLLDEERQRLQEGDEVDKSSEVDTLTEDSEEESVSDESRQ